MKATRNGKTAKPEEAANRIMQLPALDMRVAAFEIEGTTVLIQQGWSEKAIADLRAKQMGEASSGKGIRDPKKEAMGCAHIIPGKAGDNPFIGHPSVAFKKAILTVCPRVEFTKTVAIAGIQMVSEYEHLTAINYKSFKIREDIGSQNRVSTIYRPQFDGWSANLRIRYNAAEISLAQLTHLVRAAGELIGVGAWRLVGEKSTGWAGGWRLLRVSEETER